MSKRDAAPRSDTVPGEIVGRRECAAQMGRRQFLGMAGAGLGAMLLEQSLPAAYGAKPRRPPNIVFIVDDQYRQDMRKFIPTPAADRLAREGITFRNSFSTTPLCTPFRGMLMTGRYPTHSGIVLNFVNANPHSP